MLNHLAIIPDGNRRFSEKKYSNSLSGAKESRKVLVELMEWCISNKISELSVFAWSTENWKRPQREVKYAMNTLEKQLQTWIDNPDGRIAFTFVSSTIQNIPVTILEQMETLKKVESSETQLQVYIYLSYGYREGCLYPPNLKRDPDLLIRTSGERRLSNFCMGNLVYTELLFIDALFPECSCETWDDCLQDFKDRRRRYGK